MAGEFFIYGLTRSPAGCSLNTEWRLCFYFIKDVAVFCPATIEKRVGGYLLLPGEQGGAKPSEPKETKP
jgi:hypothetical protein